MKTQTADAPLARTEIPAMIAAPCHDSIISIENVNFSYEHKPVIENLNFAVLERDFIGLVGSNGAGKTTLLRMIVGQITPVSGEIRLFGQPISAFRDWERIGYVPQKNTFNPLFPATVREIVLSGLYGRKKMFRRMEKQDFQKCEDALRVMDITELAEAKVGQLSGGQQQRVFLARALAGGPELLILDEPTIGIDAQTQESFFRMIRHLHRHHNITFLIVSHDLDMLQSYLGSTPAYESGKFKFFVKHAHDPEDCEETNLTHTLQLI